jgi:RNA polymerase sigma-70 factor (ECF subfamily)
MAECRIRAFNQYRAFLFSIAYRMLGSATEAEEMLQQTFIYWQEISGSDIEASETCLVTFICRLCIDRFQSTLRPGDGPIDKIPPGSPVQKVTNSLPDVSQIAECFSVSSLTFLKQLAPLERSVFLLRKIFGYEYSEISRILGEDESNCRQLLCQARKRSDLSPPLPFSVP